MRLGRGALEDVCAKCIRDKHNISMATIEWQPPPSPSYKPSRSGEIQHSTHLHLKGSDGGGKKSAQCSLISITEMRPLKNVAREKWGTH